MMMMTIQGNLAGSYPQNNVTPIHPRKMMPTGDATNAQPIMPDAGLMIGNEGDSFTPSGTGSADLNNTPAVADAGDTVAIVKHKKKTHKAKKTSKYKKPEKKKGFAGLPWYGKTAVVVGGTILATPFVVLGTAHIWARMPSKKFLDHQQLNEYADKLINSSELNSLENLVGFLDDVHAKIKMKGVKPLPKNPNTIQATLWGLGQATSLINNLPQENRKQLVNYVSWQMWGDLFNKEKGQKEVFKNLVASCGVPAKKLFQMLGNSYSGQSEAEIKTEVARIYTGSNLPKWAENVSASFILCATEMRSKAPETPYSGIKAHIIEIVEKMNKDLPNGEKYIIAPFQEGKIKPLGIASVGQVYAISKENGEQEVLKYFTAHPDSIPEYFNLLYDTIRRALMIASTTNDKSTLSVLINFTKEEVLKKHPNLSEEKAKEKAVELLSLKTALEKTNTLKEELQVTTETLSAQKMSEAFKKAGHGHTFANVTKNGADYGSKVIVLQNRAQGIEVSEEAFRTLPITEQLKAYIEFIKLQTLYPATHNDPHSGNFHVEIANNQFVRINMLDPGRVGIQSDEQNKAKNGLQLLMFAGDDSIISQTNTATRNQYSRENETFRNTLFKDGAELHNAGIKFEADYNPFLLLDNGHSEQVKTGQAGQYNWNVEDVKYGFNAWQEMFDKKTTEAVFKAKSFTDDEKIVLTQQAKAVIEHLEKTSGITLDASTKQKAETRAKHFLLTTLEPFLKKDDARYQSVMGSTFDIEKF